MQLQQIISAMTTGQLVARRQTGQRYTIHSIPLESLLLACFRKSSQTVGVVKQSASLLLCPPAGMNLYAAAFLLPVGVMFYTAQGGLKGSYAAAWTNSVFILLALVIMSMMIYASGKRPVGSIKAVYENVSVMAGFKPVEGNKEGSYLTMWSMNGLVFGIINVIGNFGTVFVDQSYWQGAIGGKL